MDHQDCENIEANGWHLTTKVGLAEIALKEMSANSLAHYPKAKHMCAMDKML